MILFTIFPKEASGNVHCMYTDDHQLYSAGGKIEDVEKILNDKGKSHIRMVSRKSTQVQPQKIFFSSYELGN